eukprot:c27406_g3_i1 orf=166-363(+)
MKSLLRWLVEKKRVRIICHHLREKGGPHGAKKFLYGLPAPKAKTKETDNTNATEPSSQESSASII